MAYAHVDVQTTLLVPRHIIHNPDKLAMFLVDESLKDLSREKQRLDAPMPEMGDDAGDRFQNFDTLEATQKALDTSRRVVSLLRSRVAELLSERDRRKDIEATQSVHILNSSSTNISHLEIDMRYDFKDRNNKGVEKQKRQALLPSSGWSFYGSVADK